METKFELSEFSEVIARDDLRESRKNQLCAVCGHPLSEHCKGNEPHTDHKEDQRMVPLEWRRRTVTCHTRHCKNALCSCVDFQ